MDLIRISESDSYDICREFILIILDQCNSHEENLRFSRAVEFQVDANRCHMRYIDIEQHPRTE